MRSAHLLLLLLGLLAAAIFIAGCTSESSSPPDTYQAAAPPDISLNSGQWPLPNKDYSNSRSYASTPITTGNVKELQQVWSAPVAGAASNPLILDDMVYFQDLESDVHAIYLSNGTEKWQKGYNRSVLGPNGVGAGWGMIYAPAGRYDLVALDRDTGEEMWNTTLSNRSTVSISIQPVVFGGLVYVSTVAGGEGVQAGPGGGRGVIYALDARSGRIVWEFDTVDSADLWGNPSVNYGGGSYQPPGVDIVTGAIFFGTANSGPTPGTAEYPNGASRPGPNLYTNSILALDGTSGSLRWATQVYPHDLFNYGLSIPPILTRANINGQEQDILVGAGKTGRIYAFNRSTGAILWECIVGPHQNDQLATLPPGTTQVYPGGEGGFETPMAFADGVVYAELIDMYANYTPAGETVPPLSVAGGELVAVEADTGKILWEKTFPSMGLGAATVVNDVVITGTADGTLYALDHRTGATVWTYTFDPGLTGWPAISGDTIVVIGSVNQTPALNAFRLPVTQDEKT
jgi:outer membrane protein assembly factor BamB